MSNGVKSFFLDLRKKRIIEILAGFIAGGWLAYEIVHWILVVHYHLPEKLLDITLTTLLGALICTLLWRWFSGWEKPRKFKLELVLIPLVVLITLLLDINIILHLKGPEPEPMPASKWKNSIAVLPFVDLSPQKDQEYFCDGMTEELINRLSNIRELKVPARTSAFYFKGKEQDIREIGRKLDVRTVLEGSVRRAGNELRITAQLINIADGYHLWSETYDRELRDIFVIQDEIALAVADKLKLTLVGEEKAKLVKRPTENLEAYNLYLLGHHHFYLGPEANIKKAIKYYEEAVNTEPSFALAYSALADGYCTLGFNGWLAPADGYPKAKAAAMKALDLDDSLGEAHASLANVMFNFDWNFAGAEEEFLRALKLNPRSADIHIFYSWCLEQSGRSDEAIAGFERAINLDPVSSFTNRGLGWGYFFAGRYDESIVQLKATLELDPNNYWTLVELAWPYAMKGMKREVALLVDKIKALYSLEEDPALLSSAAWCYAVTGEKEKARVLLERMLDLSVRKYVDPYSVAGVYAGLGEKDRAFDWLTRGYKDRSIGMLSLKVDPFLNPLRSDPRYMELLKKMGWEK
jgi:TolB-like protein